MTTQPTASNCQGHQTDNGPHLRPGRAYCVGPCAEPNASVAKPAIKHAHEGYSCWTPKLCAALNAIAELRTAAIRYDDHELSVRLDMIEATLKPEAPMAERYAGARVCECGALIEEIDGGNSYTYWTHVKAGHIEYDHAAVPVPRSTP